jgi:sigma-E factor negative regulatory protein RseC
LVIVQRVGSEMEETGTVTEIRDRVALVSTGAKGACHSCSARGVCHLGGQKTMVVEAGNTIGAQVGDVVRIRLNSRSVLGAAFLLYLVPLLVFIGGLILGQALTHNQIWAVMLGFLCMAGTYAGIRVLDRRISRSAKMRPEIVEIVTRSSPKASPGELDHDGKSLL